MSPPGSVKLVLDRLEKAAVLRAELHHDSRYSNSATTGAGPLLL